MNLSVLNKRKLLLSYTLSKKWKFRARAFCLPISEIFSTDNCYSIELTRVFFPTVESPKTLS